jgi:hypothetical protein
MLSEERECKRKQKKYKEDTTSLSLLAKHFQK